MDLFQGERSVPDSLWDEVSSHLYCGNCGTELDISCEVGRKSEEEETADALWQEWHDKYVPKLEAFVQWLEKYPYLGIQHAVGREFMEQVKDFPSTNYTRDKWWRARRVEGPDAMTSARMGPPPSPPKSEGRYNHHGQRVFYLASSKEDAAAEVLGEGECLAWVQEFQIADRSKLLDLTHPMSHEDMAGIPFLLAGLAWSRPHMAADDPRSEWKPQYFLPRFIADCARQHGFRGIVFESPKHYGENLVLFDWTPEGVIAVGEPSLLEWRRPKEEDSPF